MKNSSPHALAELWRNARLGLKLLFDPRVPWWTKLVPLLTLVYLFWPLDLLSDPMLGLGQLDDLAVLLLGIQAFISLAPECVVQLHRAGTADGEAQTVRQDTVDAPFRVLDD